MPKSKSKNKKNNKGKSQESFISKYKWWFIGALVVIVVGYIIVYICFVGSGFLKVGIDLEKRDWLSFFGTYLSFAGTAIVSIIAILQNHFYVERDKARVVAERKKVLQPILSVKISAINTQRLGIAEGLPLNNPESLPKHKNVTIEIENVGEYPILNVIVFHKYLKQLLKSNEKIQFQIAYSDSPDAQQWKNKIIELYETEFERSDAGIPKCFNINYDDIDGNEMYQTYELKEFEETPYYSLEGTHQV